MAIWIGTCPHCSAAHMTFTTIAVDVLGDYHGNAFSTCSGCQKPVAIRFGRFAVGRGGPTPKIPANQIQNLKNTFGSANYTIMNVWPRHEESAAPDSLPKAVARNFVQADEARKRNHREAAGMAYRRALELAVKDRGPELKGTLQKRIDGLAAAGKLTLDLKTWAHSVRELGNEATHDEPEPSEADIDDLGAFTRVVLEYLYTMPAKVKRRATIVVPEAETEPSSETETAAAE